MINASKEDFEHMKISITFTNSAPDTVWNRLAARLGREPTHAEAKADVLRILTEVRIDLASKGKLKMQR